MKIKTLVDEDFVNYKIPSMYIATNSCNFKCCIEANFPIEVCQNSPWAKNKSIDVDIDRIIRRYLDNPISKSIVFSGFEPLDQLGDLVEFVCKLRCKYGCADDVVIYTGYTEDEKIDEIQTLKWPGSRLIVKFGRYVPGQEKHFDEVLGVYLASDNQYAKVI